MLPLVPRRVGDEAAGEIRARRIQVGVGIASDARGDCGGQRSRAARQHERAPCCLLEGLEQALEALLVARDKEIVRFVAMLATCADDPTVTAAAAAATDLMQLMRVMQQAVLLDLDVLSSRRFYYAASAVPLNIIQAPPHLKVISNLSKL